MKKSSFVAILLVAFGLLLASAVDARPKGHGLEGNSAQDVAGEYLPE